MKTRLSLTICTLALAAFTGCSNWKQNTRTPKDEPWSISKLWKKEYQQPRSIAAIWAPDVMSVPGRPATRGFGGRIYFYNELSQAIPIDGELMIHGYVKHSRKGESEQIAADKTFGFTAEQMASHFSPSEMGASYSVWIPWDSADGLRQEITLIPTFKGKDGTIVQGSPAKANLPGKKEEGDEDLKTPMQTVSYTQKSTPTNPGFDQLEQVKTMRTTTINVPPNASIAQPRRLESFTLGSGRTLRAPHTTRASTTAEATGVSTGNSDQSYQPSSPILDLPQLTPPAGSGFRGIDVQRLTPPPRADARTFPKVSPIPPPSNPEWTRRQSEVQPASFFDKQ